MSSPLKIVLLGAGNVGTHIARAIIKTEHKLIQIISKSGKSAKSLGNSIGVDFSDNLNEIKNSADVILMAINDDSISTVANGIYQIGGLEKKLILHTSGFCSSELLKPFSNRGVIWPLQSFSGAKKISVKKIPICYTASNQESLETVKMLAESLSKKAMEVKDDQRALLHIAAVYANNFSNHMFQIASELSNRADIDFDTLMPLIKQTFKNLKKSSPLESQTGPAKRKDVKVLEQQFGMLSFDKDLQDIYRIISDHIIKIHKR